MIKRVINVPAGVPILDLKNTVKFSQLVEESTEPITVTRNGYDVFVVMRSEDYSAMQRSIAEAKLISRINQSEEEIRLNQCITTEAFREEMRERYGL